MKNVRFKLPGNGGKSMTSPGVIDEEAPFEVEGSAFFGTGRTGVKADADMSAFNKLISLALIGGNNVVNSYCKNSKRKKICKIST